MKDAGHGGTASLVNAADKQGSTADADAASGRGASASPVEAEFRDAAGVGGAAGGRGVAGRMAAADERGSAGPGRVAEIFRAEYGRAVAVLVRHFGDIDLAEEAVQEAFVAAVRWWPERGVPPSPAG